MAKSDMVDERDKRPVTDPAFTGNADGVPAVEKNQSGQGQGAGAVTRLRDGPNSGFRTALSDNPGAGPYTGTGAAGRGQTNQDRFGDAALYDEPSNKESQPAGNQDVSDYYRDLSARPKANYDILPNMQVKQGALTLPPVEGESGFVGGAVGNTPGFSVIMGKRGFTQDQPVWGQYTSFQHYPDLAGSTDMDAESSIPHQEYSRDEFAPWKYTQSLPDNMMPQTHITRDTNDGVPRQNVDLQDDSAGGNPDTQSVPGGRDAGDTDMPDLPQTEFTHGEDGYGGAPNFRPQNPQNKDDASNLYDPQPVQ